MDVEEESHKADEDVFAVRWKLEPKSKADAEKQKRGELIEPKKPIVYYQTFRLKLPDPKLIGNAGSFFKNPILLKSDFEKIHQKFPEMKFYEVSETEVKVPAGWLIEQAGFKGKRFGDAGVHKNQALVLVNYGNATGQEILAVSKEVQKTVFETFRLIHFSANAVSGV